MSLFNSLFMGDLLIRPGGRVLASAARRVVRETFGTNPERLQSSIFRESLAQARKALTEPEFHRLALTLLRELGVLCPDLKLDHVRLRAVTPGLEKVKAAAPVFYAHRDTWYGNPKCQINVWIPLQDVDASNSFRFYLDYFRARIANDSGQFKADHFRGFGHLEPATGWCYPRAQAEPDGEIYDVRMKEEDVLLFSAAHLHQTLPNRTDKVRFSLDFRFFSERHLETNSGAPDPDNESDGLLLQEYAACDSLRP